MKYTKIFGLCLILVHNCIYSFCFPLSNAAGSKVNVDGFNDLNAQCFCSCLHASVVSSTLFNISCLRFDVIEFSRFFSDWCGQRITWKEDWFFWTGFSSPFFLGYTVCFSVDGFETLITSPWAIWQCSYLSFYCLYYICIFACYYCDR